MNILVTGGSGFAGNYISHYLADKGHIVTATYRSNYTFDDSEKIDYVKQELSQRIEINKKFDVIVHTACSRSGSKRFKYNWF